MLRTLGDCSSTFASSSALLVASCRPDIYCLLQKRWRRRILKPPYWLPPTIDNTVDDIDKDTRSLLRQISEQNIDANPSWMNSSTLLQKTSSTLPDSNYEGYTSSSRRVGLIARKLGMVPQWLNDGTRVLCTMLEFADNQVISVTDPNTWFRYSPTGKRKAFGRFGPMWLVLVGAINADPTKFTSEYRHIFNRRGIPVKEVLKGFVATEDAIVSPGTSLHVCHFNIGQHVSVTGKTIDWGFQGVVRRWGMRGQPKLGTTKSHRRVGAIGIKGEARVWPGRRLPGHMGYEWVTIPSLEVLRIIPEKQVMYIKGSVPGEIGEILMVQDTMIPEKRVKNPQFPTFFPKFNDSHELIYDEYLEKLSDTVLMDNGQIYAKKMFRFTSPSIVFTEEHETQLPGRDKSRAKVWSEYRKIAVRSSYVIVAKMPRAISAARLPPTILSAIFEYLDLAGIAACMRVCRHWSTVLAYEDSYVWEFIARRVIPEEAFRETALLSQTPTLKQKLRAFMYAWNPLDSSRNNYLRTNGFTVHRNPVAQSTDGIRGKRGVNSGVHAWEFVWEGPLGTVACIGVATKYAALHCEGYIPLLGSDDQSWGWNLVDNVLFHNNEQISSYPHVNNPPKYQVGERIRMILDCESHMLYFERGSEFLGIAFDQLPPVKLFPAICGVYGNTEVTMVYIGPPLLG